MKTPASPATEIPIESPAKAGVPRDAVERAVRKLAPTASPDSVRRLGRTGRIHPFHRHERVVEADDPAQLVLVLDGYMAAVVGDADGREFTMLVLQPGDVTGIASLARPTNSSVSIVALTTGATAVWRGTEVRSLATEDSGLSMGLLDHAVDQAQRLKRRMVQMSIEQARERFADAILTYESLISHTDPAISRGELASIMGVTREMLGVVVRDLERQLVVRRVGANIRVVDRSALTAMRRHEEDPSSAVPRAVPDPAVTAAAGPGPIKAA